MVRVRCDVLPHAVWGSTANAHACGARRGHYKNIARFFDTRRAAQS